MIRARGRALAASAALLVAAAATPAAAVPAAATPTGRPARAERAEVPVPVTELRTPDGEALSVRAINEPGQVVGTVRDETSGIGVTSVVWDRGRTTRVAPEGVAAVGLDISDRGQVVGTVVEGGYTFPPRNPTWAFSWHRGALSRLTPEGGLGAAHDVNERGQVLGVRRTPSADETVVWDGQGRVIRGPSSPRPQPVPSPDVGILPLSTSDRCGTEREELNERGQVAVTLWRDAVPHAGLWQVGGRTVDLGTLGGENAGSVAINDRGHVVGHSQVASGAERGFTWRRGRMIDLGTLAEVGSVCAGDVNDRGQVVGTATAGADGMDHAFLWENGRMTDLGTLGGRYSEAHAVNDRGQVVGRSERADGTVHAFVWEDGRMVDLGPSEPGYSQAVDVNNRGQIIGQMRTGTRGEVGVMWTVPPSGAPPRPVG